MCDGLVPLNRSEFYNIANFPPVSEADSSYSNVVASGTVVVAAPSRSRGRELLSKRSMQVTLIILIISVIVTAGGAFVWATFGHFAFPTTLCGINTTCAGADNFKTMADCVNYARANGLRTDLCSKISSDTTGLAVMIVGIALLAASMVAAALIFVTSKSPTTIEGQSSAGVPPTGSR